jgi:outer membrane protein OmpA-like peptidoglycan-associated protein
MKTHLFRTTLLAGALSAGMLSLGACATHEDVAEAVGGETTRAQQAEGALSERVSAADSAAKDASARADAAAAAAKHPFSYAVLLQDDSIIFNTASAKLSDEAQKRLTEVADKLKSEDRNVYARRHVAGHQGRQADAEVDQHAGRELPGDAARDQGGGVHGGYALATR